MAFPAGWGRKQSIAIDFTKVGGTAALANFPFQVTLDHLNVEIVDGGANSALNGGGDIRFSSDAAGTIQLPCDVVTFVTSAAPSSRACQIHVKVPSLSNTANTTIYIWYKKAGEVQPIVTDPYGRNAVWAGESAKWHFNEALGNIIDASGGGHDLVKQGTGIATYNGAGLGVHFDGNVWFDTPDSLDFDLSGGIYTVSVVVDLPTTLSGWEALIGKGTAAANTDWSFFQRWGTSDRLDNWHIGTVVAHSLWWNPIMNVGKVWITTTFDGFSDKLYINGALVHTTASTALVGHSATPLHVGSARDGTAVTAPIVTYFDTRIRNTAALTPGWITTEYNNQSSPATFAAAGVPVAVGGGLSLAINNAVSGHKVGNVAASQNHSLTLGNAVHIHSAAQITVSQFQASAGQNSLHGHVADPAQVNQFQILTVTNADHGATSDAALVAQFQALVAANATHGLVNDMAPLFNSAFTPHPTRTQAAARTNRTISSSDERQTIQPTNNRI